MRVSIGYHFIVFFFSLLMHAYRDEDNEGNLKILLTRQFFNIRRCLVRALRVCHFHPRLVKLKIFVNLLIKLPLSKK